MNNTNNMQYVAIAKFDDTMSQVLFNEAFKTNNYTFSYKTAAARDKAVKAMNEKAKKRYIGVSFKYFNPSTTSETTVEE